MAVLALSFSSAPLAQTCGSGTQDRELFLLDPGFPVDIRVYTLDGVLFGAWNSATTTADDVGDCSWTADATGGGGGYQLPNDEPIRIQFEYSNIVSSFTYFACRTQSPVPDFFEFYCPDKPSNTAPGVPSDGDIIFIPSVGGPVYAKHIGGATFGAAGGDWMVPYTLSKSYAEATHFFISGVPTLLSSVSGPTFVTSSGATFNVYNGWTATWDLDGGGITFGKLGTLDVGGDLDLGDFALRSEVPGGTWDLDVNGSLAVSGSATLESGFLWFADGEQFSVEGDLDADGTTFQALFPSQGWGGLRVESGGAATLRGGSVVREVKSFGGAAVTASGDFTLDGSDIIGSTLGAGADGIYASGSGTFVHVKNGSEISFNEGDGVYANLHAQVLVENSTIDGNLGDGVSAYKADVFLYDSAVENNASGYGANAVFLGDIAFGWPAYSTPSQNNNLDNNGSGTLRATSNSDLAAGTASGTNAQNNFIRDGSELHAYARTYSDVRAQCDWWGSASGPNLSFVDTDTGSTYTYDPFLTAPGGSCGIIQGRSEETSESTLARGDGPEAIPPLVWEALQAADAGETEAAFGLLVSAVETAATPEATARAYAALTRLARRGPSPGLAGFLSGQSQQGSERPWALAALAEVHRAADNAEAARDAATALTAEYAGTEHALSGYVALFGLAIEAGDEGAATEVLAAAEAGWPEAEVTAMMQRAYTLRLDAEGGDGAQGTVAGRPGDAPGVGAEARGAATVAEFALYPAYPNPSSGRTTVPLVLPEAAEVSVMVFDVLGRRVASLADGRAEAGRREFVLDGGALPAGLYVIRAMVRTDGGTERAFSRRVSLVR